MDSETLTKAVAEREAAQVAARLEMFKRYRELLNTDDADQEEVLRLAEKLGRFRHVGQDAGLASYIADLAAVATLSETRNARFKAAADNVRKVVADAAEERARLDAKIASAEHARGLAWALQNAANQAARLLTNAEGVWARIVAERDAKQKDILAEDVAALLSAEWASWKDPLKTGKPPAEQC